jgi:hypothetical protein
MWLSLDGDVQHTSAKREQRNGVFKPVTATYRPGSDADPSPPISAEVKNRVELYLYSP